ncbi:hypothetical protein [Fructobacillus cardui]|jgi:hypothetical protein|uniref:Uncharacterized protein n=1 Tax=Fructobacillus cardui TaxID=2893170 RepID=A0ABN9YV98_9LACO|nr:unnamed protein product [Fructobacillus cardui]
MLSVQNIGDVASLVTICGAIIAGIGWGFKAIVLNPLLREIKYLTDQFKGLNDTLREIRSHSNDLEERVNTHEVQIGRLQVLVGEAEK